MWAGVDAPRHGGKMGRIANTPNTTPTARWPDSAVRHVDVSSNHQHFPVLYYYY